MEQLGEFCKIGLKYLSQLINTLINTKFRLYCNYKALYWYELGKETLHTNYAEEEHKSEVSSHLKKSFGLAHPDFIFCTFNILHIDKNFIIKSCK